ncbi:MAG: ornithine decarboxylase, partial [Actinobacteria bacterium]|nr:ornithine decarboxylase [Actinomycetota bacterium]
MNPTGRLDHDRTPYLDALVAYAGLDRLPFHVPGHLQGRGAHPLLHEIFGPKLLALDLCSGLGNFDGGPDSG